MMTDAQEEVIKTIFALQDECLEHLRSLREVLLRERQALICLDTDTVQTTTLQKASLNQTLSNKKKRIWSLVDAHFSLNTTEGLLDLLQQEYKNSWKIKEEEWLKIWSDTKRTCETNQLFLKHSLRNFSLLVDNLRRLLGDQPLYSRSGQKKEVANQGKMVERSY